MAERSFTHADYGMNTVAVLGSGVMGAAIAALLANAGCKVHLLDIVPDGADDRNMLAKKGITNQLKAKPASGFTHKRNAKRVMPGNLEDDLERLAECDWIIEVVLEDLQVKQETYRKIDAHRKAGSIVSSNTSTLPLHILIKDMPESFAADFMITHFFNPPRFLSLLEVTGGTSCKPEHLDRIEAFADRCLGKGVVRCKDTPGFLANRIGIFWMCIGLFEALEMGMSVEDADAVMSRPIGVPKTALFGLYDLIGIDLMPHIAKAMLATLPEADRFRSLYHEPETVREMIDSGYTGRKGKGGFYRMHKEGGKKTKQVKDLTSGEYGSTSGSRLKSVEAAKGGLRALLEHPDQGGEFAKRVMVQLLHYAASLVPEISDDIRYIDEAMRRGFAWKYGPFELIDRLSTKEQTGSDWLAEACAEAGLEVPPLLQAAKGKRFYHMKDAQALYLDRQGEYQPITVEPDKWMLEERVRGEKPVWQKGGGRLWDLGDGIACLEITTKMNTIDDTVQDAFERAMETVERDFDGLVIGTDADKFSLGANLGFVTYLANMAAWDTISEVILRGHRINMALKYAPFPVVASVSGMALGGGCELMLHCDAVQAHMECYPGLVELGVGLVPGWGGCKELLFRHAALAEASSKAIASGKMPKPFMADGPMPMISKTFEYIMTVKVASSAEEASEMLILNNHSGITMHRSRVLPDAKARCLSLVEDYAPPERPVIRLPGATGHTALMMAVQGFVDHGKASPHDAVIGDHLATILTGGDTDIHQEMSEQDVLDLEHEHFMAMVQMPATQDRIAHMLATNKPLRN